MENTLSNFCVCWRDTHGDFVEQGVVHGETHMDWAEAEEVASYFRAEQDGLEYYVGHPNAVLARPPIEEAADILKYLKEQSHISPAEYKVLSYWIGRAK